MCIFSFQLTDLQVGLFERDKIIQELSDALKQSISIRDRLNERNENLAKEIDELKTAHDRKRWIADRNTFDDSERRISQTLIDLVDESDLEDDELNNKIETTQDIESKPEEQQLKSDAITVIEEFKESLDQTEVEMFARVQEQFEQMFNDKLNDITNKLHQEQFEKAELELEANRLRQLLANVKSGSTEVMELRAELEKIHKKEMEKLRMYFERKCTDLEKQ